MVARRNFYAGEKNTRAMPGCVPGPSKNSPGPGSGSARREALGVIPGARLRPGRLLDHTLGHQLGEPTINGGGGLACLVVLIEEVGHLLLGQAFQTAPTVSLFES